MNLGNFNYNTAKILIDYSNTIDNAISLYNTAPSIGAVDGKDYTEYWEQNNQNDICHGRYLRIQIASGVQIKFWTGLHFTPADTDFIVWFKKTDISVVNVNTLRNNFKPKGQLEETNEEVWISMDKTMFGTLCDDKTACGQHEKIIKGFWDSVFGIII